MEGIDAAVGRNIPALGGAWNHIAAIRRESREALEERAENRTLRHADRRIGIEIARFGSVADMQNLLADADFNRAFARAACNDGPSDGQQRGGARQASGFDAHR
jgi:hypothetical protein